MRGRRIIKLVFASPGGIAMVRRWVPPPVIVRTSFERSRVVTRTYAKDKQLTPPLRKDFGYQDIKVMELRYQERWDTHMVANTARETSTGNFHCA
ncbi:hypothetical protein AVEN_181616-1 [Araneus ventricosus]|uniref:Uncharacterized protein n=1 Tax=Araneus ventricosus TaxID=182803 RepID=A0A4Y2CNB6_ARAVE|nr:hypothetical protein AVEN_181616-1 [Araneus ventricosus]